MFEVILESGERTIISALDLVDLIARFPDVLYAKQIS